MQSKRRFIIDTDTASDDAVALLMALRHPNVTVEAITVVSGNVPLPQASINARLCVELCQMSVPVYEGAARPLVRAAQYADWFHGADGMGDMNYPAPQTAAAGTDAIEELIRRFEAAPGEIELVTLGPLTNIALALEREPRLAQWVKHCFVMGGAACCVGNVTPAAEYNMWVDPEAAHRVFHSGMPITMIGWEHSRHDAAISQVEVDDILNLKTELAQFAIDCNRVATHASIVIQKASGLMLADPVAMAVALEPSVCISQKMHYVDVACDAELTRGMTVVDALFVTHKEPNVNVCWAIDVARWKEALIAALV